MVKQILEHLLSSYWTPHIFLSTPFMYVISVPSTWQPEHTGSISKRGIIYRLTPYICAIYERAHFAFVSVSYTWEVFSKLLLGLPKNDNCRYVCIIPRGKEERRIILEVAGTTYRLQQSIIQLDAEYR